ncbi:o-succinylbenzoate synthase [Sphingomonas sp. Root710]|uniref:o-succinylbenzoate synthase n=1 Tax=Sphingomonas sp. Root710 TaxID=1736594 RepID=UPI0006F84575|nr:o-succinylbenzoate synthase [Sphingomonas sp. Root710]KRB80676.1 o-succinylbenzoate synthase [Sphingomonas sp. Root710]
MRIEKIELFHVAMPLISPWRTAYGEDHVIESVLVAMHAQGEVGWGEAGPLATPTYSPEYAAGVFHTMKSWLAPCLIGKDIRTGQELGALLDWVKGNPFAKAGLDMAWWDLSARQAGRPLCTHLGGSSAPISVGADFGICDSIQQLVTSVAGAVAAGFPRVKLKIREGWDLAVVQAVRREFPSLTMHVDCNGGYRLDDRRLFEALDELGLEMIEQPLAHDDLLDHAQLQSALQTPICLDESITGTSKARKAIEIGACRYVNIKPGRVGGMSNAIAIHDLCQDKSIPCWVGSMLESAIGASQCLALGTLPGFTYPADMFTAGVLYAEDIGSPEIGLSAPGTVEPSSLPGIGVRPDPARLAARTLSQASI